MADEPVVPSTPQQQQQHPPTANANAAPLGHNVIPIVNKLQDIFAQLGSSSTIELPQVAVVGSQSSGKSSVLEALVGRDFLPRGSDICTRRPLVLQLLQIKRKPDGTDEEYGEFLHVPGKKFYDFNEIRKEIQHLNCVATIAGDLFNLLVSILPHGAACSLSLAFISPCPHWDPTCVRARINGRTATQALYCIADRAETDREAGGNKGVSDKQIRLKIFSPNVLDITLVDLPGITKVPVGDQPTDIEARYRTIGVITKLDIMDRGTDARNFLLGKVIPLRLGYVGVVNRSQEDIMFNRTIKDALVAEEKFFRNRPVYSELADRCGVPQLAKKLNQILVQHIKTVLPGLKSRVSATLVSVAKEHASYGEITESKAGMGALLLNILSKYSEAFSSMIEGKNEEMSTSELSGGARIHYIFQSIFVKSLEEVDPCEDLTDDDIRTAIQNATGPRSALFVPEIPFEVLIRRQIARLLDPSVQCARFIYDELIKMSHNCMVNELQRFPVLRKRMDDVIGNFLRDGLQPSETMIGHIVEMEMDYINTSHPNFIGGSKAVETAIQQVKSSRVTIPRQKDAAELDKASQSERGIKSRAILGRPVNGFVTEQQNQPGSRPVGEVEKPTSGKKNSCEILMPVIFSGSTSWGISSIFGGSDNRNSNKENSINKPFSEPVHTMDHMDYASSMIHLKEPPTVLRPSDANSDQEAIEIHVTKLLLRSYYDIVRKNIEDYVPKAIMHFLVNHTKRELHNVFIKKLYRDDLFEQMLQEPDEVAVKRKRTRDLLRVLQQAFRTLDELPLEAETVERGYSLTNNDPTGLPKIHGLPTSSMYPSTSGSRDSYTASPNNQRSRKSHSGELNSPFYGNIESNGNNRNSSLLGLYPTHDL
ncbi:Dynamin [Cynara cardunculus var. scolymus]|uniref:Dynamin n=1 Tax=Cynara cardunculus var. scolymus TaxID=59895 RepID=A0A118K0T3_CYNCS|nr:Dynamin [Cynara cardunculus var. scolymus]